MSANDDEDEVVAKSGNMQLWFPLLLVVITIVLGLTVTSVLVDREETNVRESTAAAVEIASLVNIIASYSSDLSAMRKFHGMVGFYTIQDNTSFIPVSHDTHRLLYEFPQIPPVAPFESHRLRWLPLVRREQRSAFEAELSSLLGRNATIQKFDGVNPTSLTPLMSEAEEQDFYLPVAMDISDPLSTVDMGLDMLSIPHLRDTFLESLSTLDIAVSPSVCYHYPYTSCRDAPLSHLRPLFGPRNYMLWPIMNETNHMQGIIAGLNGQLEDSAHRSTFTSDEGSSLDFSAIFHLEEDPAYANLSCPLNALPPVLHAFPQPQDNLSTDNFVLLSGDQQLSFDPLDWERTIVNASPAPQSFLSTFCTAGVLRTSVIYSFTNWSELNVKSIVWEIRVIGAILTCVIAVFAVTGSIFVGYRDAQRRKREKEHAKIAEIMISAQGQAILATHLRILDPLHTIFAMSPLLLSRAQSLAGNTSTIVGDMEIICASSRRLHNLARDLRALAEQDTVSLSVTPAVFDIRAAVREMVITHRSFSKVPLSWHVDSDVPRHCYSDAGRVTQIIANGLTNSIKYCDARGGKISVTVTYVAGSESLIISVIDNGPGLGGKTEEELFSAFTSGGAIRQDAHGNTIRSSGLGLSLASKLATALHGELHLFRLEAEKQTHLQLTLPVVFSSAPTTDVDSFLLSQSWAGGEVRGTVRSPKLLQTASERHLTLAASVNTSSILAGGSGNGPLSAGGGTGGGSSTRSGSQRRLQLGEHLSVSSRDNSMDDYSLSGLDPLQLHCLVVDDAARVRHALQLALTALGCTCEQAETGEQTLSRMSSSSTEQHDDWVDVVLIDSNLADGESGDSVRQRLREDGCQVPIIGVGEDLGSASGVAVWTSTLSKPFALHELHSALSVAIASRSLPVATPVIPLRSAAVAPSPGSLLITRLASQSRNTFGRMDSINTDIQEVE